MEGGGQGSKKNYDLVCKIVGAENVDSYYVHDESRKKSLLDYAKALVYFPLGYYYGLTPSRVKEICQLAQGYDIVFVDRSLFGIVCKRLKESGYQGRVVSYFHNVEKIYFDAKLPKYLPFRSVITRCADKNDHWTTHYADAFAALNERDDKIIESLYGRKADVLIPVALKDACQVKNDEELTSKKLKCLSIGSYFAPNNEGILWFVRNVLPNVDIDYKIVGKGMGKLKSENMDILQDVEVVGDAPSLTPYFQDADVMILPIFSGSGMKVKTCESLMNGKNIIASSEAFEGYNVDYDKVGGLCDSADDFIARINEFAENPRPRWNSYSRQMYETKYSDKAIENAFRTLLGC